MREVTYYLADDGTKFDDEIDCLNYELQLEYTSATRGCIQVFNEDFKELILTVNDASESFYNDSYIVFILNEEGEKLMGKLNDHFGWCFPEKIGKYMYESSPFEEQWIDLVKKEKEMREWLEKYGSLEDKLMRW